MSKTSEKKRITLTALAVALAFASSGCGTDGDSVRTDESGQQTSVKVGLALPNSESEFFTELREGAEREAYEQGVKLRVREADSAMVQEEQLRTFIQQNLDAIVVTPVDPEEAAFRLTAAREAGIPVVVADRTVKDVKVTSVVTSDNAPGGGLAADALAGELNGKGTVAVLRGGSGLSTSKERGKGFAEAIKKYPDIEVVAEKVAGFDRGKGAKAMADLLSDHPGISGVFAENDEMALGAVKALGSKAGDAGDKVRVVGFDGSPAGVRAVEKGTLSATVAQQPQEVGKVAVRNAVRAALGERVDAEILVPVRLVTGDS